MNKLHLTNSLTNKKEVFNPINKEKVSNYPITLIFIIFQI